MRHKLLPLIGNARSGCILLAVLVGSSCSPQAKHEKVRKLLEGCPAWTSVQEGDRSARMKIISYLSAIATYDSATIRSGVVSYLSSGAHADDPEGKVFLLNRYLFTVPDWGSPEELFGAWRNPVREDGNVNLLWPLSVGGSGKLELTGTFTGYTGESYRPLDEFDYYQKKYSLRISPTKR